MDLSIWPMGLEFSSTCSSVPRRIVLDALDAKRQWAMSRSPMRFGFCAPLYCSGSPPPESPFPGLRISIPLQILSAACSLSGLPLIYCRG